VPVPLTQARATARSADPQLEVAVAVAVAAEQNPSLFQVFVPVRATVRRKPLEPKGIKGVVVSGLLTTQGSKVVSMCELLRLHVESIGNAFQVKVLR